VSYERLGFLFALWFDRFRLLNSSHRRAFKFVVVCCLDSIWSWSIKCIARSNFDFCLSCRSNDGGAAAQCFHSSCFCSEWIVSSSFNRPRIPLVITLWTVTPDSYLLLFFFFLVCVSSQFLLPYSIISTCCVPCCMVRVDVANSKQLWFNLVIAELVIGFCD